MTDVFSPVSMNGMVVIFNPINPDVDGDDGYIIETLGGELFRKSLRQKKEPTHEYVEEGREPASGLLPLTHADVERRLNLARLDFEEFLARHARPARIPFMKPAVSEGTATRWFGRPCMPASQRWPGDIEPMDFVAQFDAGDIPGGLPNGASGLLLFIEEGGSGDGDDAEVILVYPGEACVLHDLPEGTKKNAPLDVVKWRDVVDHPWLSEERDLEGCQEIFDLQEVLTSMTCGEVTLSDDSNVPEAEAAMLDISPIIHTWECDKVGGWPRWEQGKDVPLDHKGTPMRFVLQVGYEGLVLGDADFEAVDWPTWGRGQVFVSETTGEARYVWACD